MQSCHLHTHGPPACGGRVLQDVELLHTAGNGDAKCPEWLPLSKVPQNVDQSALVQGQSEAVVTDVMTAKCPCHGQSIELA